MNQKPDSAEETSFADIHEIMRVLPHRYPMLMIDRVVDISPDHRAVGIKSVTINEPHFQGHFPNKPVMPGVMLVEAMAQTAAILVARSDKTIDPDEGKLVYFMTIDGARFRKPVTPGDVLRIPVIKKRRRGNVWKFDGICEVDGGIVAEATFSAMVVDE